VPLDPFTALPAAAEVTFHLPERFLEPDDHDADGEEEGGYPPEERIPTPAIGEHATGYAENRWDK
jgi:hypothetical protein